MSYNDFTGTKLITQGTLFKTPSEISIDYIKEYESIITQFLGCSLRHLDIIQWGDQVGNFNNILMHSLNRSCMSKMNTFCKEIAENIKITEDIPENINSSFLTYETFTGVTVYYDRANITNISSLIINEIKVVKLCFTTAPGPSSDWVETFTYLIVNKDNGEKFISYIANLMRKNKTGPVFHVIGAHSSEETNIEPFSWEQVILAPDIVKLLKEDFESFFKRERWFKEKKLPFRRGYLLHGDPGNGKTSAIKAMMWGKNINAYTLSFFDKNVGLSELNKVFEMAGDNKPSLVVLEDIDRAFPKAGSECAISLQELLNAIDGIGTKEGIITIATANNPADLDAAILKRPGRFDRSIKFDNPTKELRIKYFKSKDEGLFNYPEMEEALDASEGYSFAQLQETYILAGQAAYDAGEQANITGQMILDSVKLLADSNKGVKKLHKAGF